MLTFWENYLQPVQSRRSVELRAQMSPVKTTKKQTMVNYPFCTKSLVLYAFIITPMLVIVATVAILAPIGLYLGVSQFAYKSIYLAGRERNVCWKDNVYKTQNPSNFTSFLASTPCAPVQYMNFTKYHIPFDLVEEIEFTPKDDVWNSNNWGKLSGWLYNYDNFTGAPVVITVHGIRGCKRMHESILPAAMLFKQGYNVLSIDLRNHGDSPDLNPPYVSFGNSEYKDVLGAVDYLENRFGASAIANLGLFGVSMGGAVSIVAYQNDDRFKALFADSPACDVYSILIHGASEVIGPMTSSILGGGCTIHGTSNGCAPFTNDPLKSSGKLIDRPIHFDHCYSDSVVPIESSKTCMAAIERVNTVSHSHISRHYGYSNITSQCTNHVILMLTETDQYEERLLGFFNKYLKNN